MYIFCLRNEKNIRAPKAFGAIQITFHKWTEFSLSMQATDAMPVGLTLGFLTLSLMRPTSSKTSAPVTQPAQPSYLTPQLLEDLAKEVTEMLQKKKDANKISSQNRDSLSIQ